MRAADTSTRFPMLGALRDHPDIALAAGILSILFVILMPLPCGLVDPLLILNLTVSVVILLTAACVSRPLDFSVFPSLLLVTTFFRLALNIATTRLILGNAAEGPLAAGKVVRTFGQFVAADNPIIGLIIFMVIVVVQFVVITKGATRVSEVAARFQLDALPGKQLSIDADLAAKLIDQETARARRSEVSREADFYGAMDGASKFVRGDAVAGLVIVLINILGGIAVGFFYHDMNLAGAVNVFSRLTIGDGLVSQVPALMVSIAAALLVTRSAASEHLGKDLSRQLFSNDQVLFVAAAFLLLLLPSGLPAPALLVGAGACASCGYLLRRERLEAKRQEAPAGRPRAPRYGRASPADVRSLLYVEPIAVHIGYRLLPLIDESRGGDLMERIANLRESIAVTTGLVLPPVRVRDSRGLEPAEYSILLRGNSLGRWEIEPRGFLAVPKRKGASSPRGGAMTPPAGKPGPELRGAETRWISDPENLPAVEDYDLLRPPEALAMHLDLALRSRAADILTREEVSRMLEGLRRHSPSLVDDLIPNVLKVSDLYEVLKRLLDEGVSVRDLESILESLGRFAGKPFQLSLWVEEARRSQARSICAPATGADGKIHALLLDPALEEFLLSSLETVDGDLALRLDPQTTESIRVRTAEALESLAPADWSPALLCSPRIRAHMWRMVGNRVPAIAVLSYDEVLDINRVEVHGTVSLESPLGTPARNKEVHSEGWMNKSLVSKPRR